MSRPVALTLAALVLIGPLATVRASPPTWPDDLTARSGEGRIFVSWDPVPSWMGVLGYRLYFQTDQFDVWALLVDTPQTSYVDGGHGDGFVRKYRVTAYNADGESWPSSWVIGSTFASSTNGDPFSAGFTVDLDSPGVTTTYASSVPGLHVTGGGSERVSRPLPRQLTRTTADFTISTVATVTPASFTWRYTPLILLPTGATDIDNANNVLALGIESSGPSGSETLTLRVRYRDSGGVLQEAVSTSWSGYCVEDPCDTLSFGLQATYDADARRLYAYVGGPFGMGSAVLDLELGRTATDGFIFDRLAFAAHTGPSSNVLTSRYTVTTKGEETTPARIPSIALAHPGHRTTTATYPAVVDAGTSPVLGYRLYRDGVLAADVSTLSATDGFRPRYAPSTYSVVAYNEMGESVLPRAAAAVPGKLGRAVDALHDFDGTDHGYTSAGSASSNVFWQPSAENVELYARLQGARTYSKAMLVPWNDDDTSWSVSGRWRETTSAGAGQKACVLALLPSATSDGDDPSTVCFRYHAAAPGIGQTYAPSYALRFIDASGAVSTLGAFTGTVGAEYAFEASYDATTRVLAMTARNAGGAVVASGSTTLASTQDFLFTRMGVISGAEPTGSGTTTAAAGWVDDLAFDSEELALAGAPSAPAGVALARGPGPDEMSLSWDAHPDAVAYHVYRATADGTQTWRARTTGTSFLEGGLAPSTTVSYFVSVENAVGESPLASGGAATSFALPDAPDVAGARGPLARQITASWTPPASTDGWPVLSYTARIQRLGGEGEATVEGITETSYTFGGLVRGALYRVYVQAHTAVGAGPWGSSLARAPDYPGSVVGLASVAGPGASEATISWSAPFDTGGLPVTYRIRAANYEVVADTTTTSYAVTGLAGPTTFRVAAVNDVGEGWLADVVARPPTLPSAPRSLAVARSAAPGELGLAWQPPLDAGGGASLTYRVFASVAGGAESLAGETSGTSFVHAGLPDATIVSYRVAAANVAGQGAFSLSAANRTLGAPPAPGSLAVATGGKLGNLTLTWTAPQDAYGRVPIDGYELWRTPAGGSPELVDLLGAAATSYQDAGLPDNATFTYGLHASNAVGDGTPATAGGTTLRRLAPTAPQVSATTTGVGTVRLDWSGEPDLTRPPVATYGVWRGPEPGSERLVALVPGSLRAYTDRPPLTSSGEVVLTWSYLVKATSPGGTTASDPRCAFIVPTLGGPMPACEAL